MDFTFVIINVPPFAINKKHFTDRGANVPFHHETMTGDMGRISDWHIQHHCHQFESLTLLSQRLNARGGEGEGKGGVLV